MNLFFVLLDVDFYFLTEVKMSIHSQIKDILWEALFPSDGRCIFCKKLLLFEPNPFCYSCLDKIPWVGERVCKKCGKEEIIGDTGLCIDCAHWEHQYEQGISLFTYTGNGKKIIQEIKFNGNRKLALWTGKKIGQKLRKQNWQKKIQGIVPVPLHENRMKERGFNQSEELAKGISSILDIFTLKDLLIRIKDTPHQTDLTRSQRQENIKKAFQVRDSRVIQGKKVLLVDDVYTTGATINACAETLKQAGAREVYFAVAATGKSMMEEVFSLAPHRH